MKNFLSLLIICICISNHSKAQKDIDDIVKAYEKVGYHGSILVAKGDKVLYRGAYGVANQLTGQKNNVDTKYKTESIGKMLTATLVMQEIEKGTLSLEDSLDHFFPNMYYQNGKQVKIKHLLSHTSGITDTEMNPSYRPGNNYSRADILKLRADAPLAFNIPGTQFRYSNLGYTLLADILEKINQKKFDQLIKERIFLISKMNHTGHPSDTLLNKNIAKPYLWVNSNKYMEETRTVGKYANASGGWLSTVDDFYQFMNDVRKHKFINKKTWNIMQTANSKGGIEFQPGYFYTYGLNVSDIGTKGRKIYGHTGGGGGYACDIYLEPKSGYIVINFMNMYGDGRIMTKNVFNFLLNEGLTPIKKWDDIALGDVLASKGLESFAKNYKAELSNLNMLPNTPGGYNRLAGSYDDVNDQLTREALLLVGLKEFPNSGLLWLNLGRSLIKQKRNTDAKAALVHALEIGDETKDNFLMRMSKNELDKIK